MSSHAISISSSLTPTQLKALKANIITEHFGWSPESFAKSAMDLANVCMYAATESAEQALSTHEAELDEEEIQKGIYKLETLLENAIDKHFDLYEIYVLRNTFSIPTDIIPFLRLAHHETLDPSLVGADAEALDEYTQELEAYEAELARSKALRAAREWINVRVDQVSELANEIGYMGSADPLLSKAKAVQSQLDKLYSSLSSLLETPTPAISSGPKPTESDPWGTSRSAYINWAASEKLEKQEGRTEGEQGIGKVADSIAATGAVGDAQALLANLQGKK